MYWEHEVLCNCRLGLAELRAIARSIERKNSLCTVTLISSDDPSYALDSGIGFANRALRLAAWTDDPYGPHPDLDRIERMVNAYLGEFPKDADSDHLVPVTKADLKVILAAVERSKEVLRKERFPQKPERTKKCGT